MWGLGERGAVIVAVVVHVDWVAPRVPNLSAFVWGIHFYMINTQR